MVELARKLAIKAVFQALLPRGPADRLRRMIFKVLNAGVQRSYFESHRIRKLQVAAGGNSLDGWLNTDLQPSLGVLFLDAGKPFPFNAGSFDYVFSEHFIEHLDYLQGLHFLRECYRVLKPGGKIRISTPDLSFLIQLYHEPDSEAHQEYVRWSIKECCLHADVPFEAFVINNFFHDWGHQFIYDYRTLEHALQRAGFVHPKRLAVGCSDDENLRDIERHGQWIPPEHNQLESMVVEAEKL
jgi:predicted SAM-dependent methyltransferase